MNAELSAVVDKMQAMLNGFIALLPNLVLALIVFAIFFSLREPLKELSKN